MTQKELFEIAKKLVIYSGVKKKISAVEAKKILRELRSLLEKVKTDNSSLGKQVKRFLADVIDDIEQGREIDIDHIEQDEYIENYLNARAQVDAYNTILSKEFFTLANTTKSREEFSQAIKNIKKQALSSFRKLDAKVFAQMLLIISVFPITKPKKYLKVLYERALNISDYNSAQIIYSLIAKIDTFYDTIQMEAIKVLEK